MFETPAHGKEHNTGVFVPPVTLHGLIVRNFIEIDVRNITKVPSSY